jgi:hypothetical protein
MADAVDFDDLSVTVDLVGDAVITNPDSIGEFPRRPTFLTLRERDIGPMNGFHPITGEFDLWPIGGSLFPLIS